MIGMAVQGGAHDGGVTGWRVVGCGALRVGTIRSGENLGIMGVSILGTREMMMIFKYLCSWSCVTRE